ncbi:hypothetical protein SEHO0A_01386 [Salmonella enterica subsp. houtenae str. ATCC BAA-1581]|nr:hypothetical protein SEHO0A_01386 [Salmonella enterica subsp. houtenae str. ATCC BAA-1581]
MQEKVKNRQKNEICSIWSDVYCLLQESALTFRPRRHLASDLLPVRIFLFYLHP